MTGLTFMLTISEEGVGTRLLGHIENGARGRGLKCLVAQAAVTNLKMLNFAAKHGFRFSKYLKAFWDPETGDAFLLIKRLKL